MTLRDHEYIMISTMMRSLTAVLAFLACTGPICSEGAKIVGYPMFGGSQYMGMRRIAEELAHRGHEVTLLVSSTHIIKPADGVHQAVYNVPFKKDFLEKSFIKEALKKGFRALLNPQARQLMPIFCEALLNATELLEPLKAYDLIITDTSMFCGPLIAEYLNITRIEYCPISARNVLMHFHHAPAYLSYVPTIQSRNPGTMNFLQRVKNTLVYSSALVIMKLLVFPQFEDIKQKFGINPGRSYLDSMGDAELVLFLADFALDYPFPLLPGFKMIGAPNIQPPRPLSPEYEALMTSSGEHGAIIVSFGSNVASILEKREVDVMAEAFGRLKQTIIWRLKGYIPSKMAPNIKVVKWMPQNDLLAHEKMRAFISHVGQNSLYESAYYGVPLVALPLFGDQFDQAVLVEDKGLGLGADIHTVTADQLYSLIQRVLKDNSFRATAHRISSLMQDRRRTPVQEAGDWVEYTLRHGRLTHLRPASVHLTWYQYFLLDVMLFLVMVLVVVAMVIRLIFGYLCSFCCKGGKKVKTQ